MFLTGKTALITGSTSGIGLAYARALAAEGASIMMNGFGDAAAIEAERTNLMNLGASRTAYSSANMARPDEIAEMIRSCADVLGHPDILINNAGIQHVAPIDEFPAEKWDAVIAINLSAVFYAIRAALPGMKAKGWGRIINTASVHSLVASPNKAAYVAAKHGVAGITKTVALEVAHAGITANCISPGYVWTSLVDKQIPDLMKTRGLARAQVMTDVLLGSQPTKKFVTAEQVASLAVFLCSPGADSINGANLSMDGGWTAM
jgi:3-hydroxybutyrate dehydrogenase